MLTALAPGEAVTPEGAVEGEAGTGAEALVAAMTGSTEATGRALLRRGLVAAGRMSAQGVAQGVATAPAGTSDVPPPADAAPATDDASTPVLPAADGAAASGTSLMQWMLQMVPPAPPAQPSGAGPLVGGPGDALSSAGSGGKAIVAPGRTDSDGKTAETRARGVSASMSQADRLSDTALADAGAARRPLAAAGTSASPDGGVVASVVAERARASASMPETDRGVSADLTASTAQAAMAAAAATATVTTSGSPVVAPAQTWIQTPVTQPGFSDEVVVELVRRIGQSEQGPHEVMLHLNPADMGPVSVSIELNGTTARVEFSASEALTRHHLEAALPGLAEALRDEGLSLQHGAVHEQRPDAWSADAGLSGGSTGGGADPRSRGEPSFDGRSGLGERAPRQPTPMFTQTVPATATTERAALSSLGPGPGRLGRLDLFA